MIFTVMNPFVISQPLSPFFYSFISFYFFLTRTDVIMTNDIIPILFYALLSQECIELGMPKVFFIEIIYQSFCHQQKKNHLCW